MTTLPRKPVRISTRSTHSRTVNRTQSTRRVQTPTRNSVRRTQPTRRVSTSTIKNKRNQ